MRTRPIDDRKCKTPYNDDEIDNTDSASNITPGIIHNLHTNITPPTQVCTSTALFDNTISIDIFTNETHQTLGLILKENKKLWQ